jgi:membrane-associated protease RseP (regulator of RpoE activity)
VALRHVTVSAAGVAAESANTTAALITAAGVANAEVGLKADVTTELAAITAAVPTGALVVSIDTSLVTTKNKLRQLLDATYDHIVASNLLT